MASETGDVGSVDSERRGFGFSEASEVELCWPSVADSTVGEGLQVGALQGITDSQPVSHVNFEHAVGAAWDSLKSESAEPIWNDGFWKCIFGDDAFGPKLENVFKRPMPVDETACTDVDQVETFKKTMFAEFFSFSCAIVQDLRQEHRGHQLARKT